MAFNLFSSRSNGKTVGQDLVNFKKVYTDRIDISRVNQTLLVLIPKVPKPNKISQFQPIGLCDIVYKVVTKTLVNKMKMALPHLISNNQSSFVPGRHIIDNIIVT